MELIFCGPIIFCSHYERKFQWNLRKRTNYSQIIWNKKTGNIYIIILLTEFKLSVILWYIFKNGFVVFHITLLTVEISSKKRKSPKKTSKKFYNVWFHAIRLFKFLFWHVLIYQDNFNPIVEGNCANLFMVVCWWIHNFGFLYSGYHLVLTWSNNLYCTCWWACYNWWKLLRLYLVYFPFVIIESNGDHHSKLVSLSFTFAFLFSVLQMWSSIVCPLML